MAVSADQTGMAPDDHDYLNPSEQERRDTVWQMPDDAPRVAPGIRAELIPDAAAIQQHLTDDRKRLPDGSIVNEDGSIIPPMDPDLVARLEAAKDENGVIHDPVLADEWFDAIVKQGDEGRRLAGWPEPIIEQGSVFPSAEGEEVLPPYGDGDPPAPFIPAEDDGDDDDPQPVRVIIF